MAGRKPAVPPSQIIDAVLLFKDNVINHENGSMFYHIIIIYTKLPIYYCKTWKYRQKCIKLCLTLTMYTIIL